MYSKPSKICIENQVSFCWWRMLLLKTWQSYARKWLNWETIKIYVASNGRVYMCEWCLHVKQNKPKKAKENGANMTWEFSLKLKWRWCGRQAGSKCCKTHLLACACCAFRLVDVRLCQCCHLAMKYKKLSRKCRNVQEFPGICKHLNNFRLIFIFHFFCCLDFIFVWNEIMFWCQQPQCERFAAAKWHRSTR